ncbi:hypothetical protein ACNKHN_21040 [Shigella flexneri]
MSEKLQVVTSPGSLAQLINGMVARTLPEKLLRRAWKSMRHLPLPTFPCMTLTYSRKTVFSNSSYLGGTDPSG